MKKLTIDLDIEQATEFVREDLIDYYDCATFDLEEDSFDLVALRRVIKIYSTPDQYEQFCVERDLS